MSRDDWSLAFYIDEHGDSPVEELLDGLDTATRTIVQWSMEQLRVRNVLAREPLVRHLADDLWELRVESRGNAYRVIYFFLTGRHIIFLHGFLKKTQRTPRREMEMAQRRYRRFLAESRQ